MRVIGCSKHVYLALPYIAHRQHSTTMNSTSGLLARPGNDAKALQERLHELISRVSDSIDIVKSWPESSGDDASIHVKTTSKLIHSIREILHAIGRVEGVVKKKVDTGTSATTSNNNPNDGDSELWKTLQQCPIPLDLLEMLDCSNGLNPEIFVRGLLREGLSQLAGLRRRKVALEMLGNTIQAGLDARPKLTKRTNPDSVDRKRSRDNDGIESKDQKSSEPPSKRQNTE